MKAALIAAGDAWSALRPAARAGSAGAAVRPEPPEADASPVPVGHRRTSVRPRLAPSATPVARPIVDSDATGAACSTRSAPAIGHAAQAGIAALPPGILTPVAKAELYTAKGSPTVDLASLQALIAEAPELPQAEQLARMAHRPRRDDLAR